MEAVFRPRYTVAGINDIDVLVRTRLTVLHAANGLPEDQPLSEVAAESQRYYEQALRDGTHTAILVYDGDRFIGAGGISYYAVMPTVHNVTGHKAYIMNIYTHPDYRRRGIAMKTLSMLVNDALAKGVTHISLEATDAGRPLYERFGFVSMEHEMELPEDFLSE